MTIHAIIEEILWIVDEAYSAGWNDAAAKYGAAHIDTLNVQALRCRAESIRSGSKLVQESIFNQLTRTS